MQNTPFDPAALLDEDRRAWLESTIERNRNRFAGWSMVLDSTNSADDADDAGDGADDGEESEDSGADDTKDAETEDWKAKFEAQQRVNRNLERRTKKDAQRIKELTGDKPKTGKTADEQPDADKIRAEAKAEAEREALHGRIEDKIEAKAAAFADPEDAVAVLMRSHDIEDFIDGDKPDVDAIVDALKELGEKKPHLLAQGGKRFQGGADQGARKENKGRARSLGDAIARHYEKS